MKAITLWQPWASLMAVGAKRIETRSWPTAYRGPLLIHAAKTWNKDLAALYEAPHFGPALARGGYPNAESLPRGCAVAACRLAACRVIDPGPGRVHLSADADSADLPPYPERAFGDYAPGRYAWVIEHVVRLPEPIPMRGAMGLFDPRVSLTADQVSRLAAMLP